MLEVECILPSDLIRDDKIYRIVEATGCDGLECNYCDLDGECPEDHNNKLICTRSNVDKAIWKEIKVVKKTDTLDKPITDYSDKAEGITTYVGRKFDQEKPRYDLLPANALEEVVKVLTYGASKYDDENWRKVPEGRRRYFAASQRHQWQHKRGELIDADSKCYHLACAITSLMFILEKELTNEPDIKE